MRLSQSAIALLTAQVTSLAIAHAGKNPPSQDINDYLPIQEILPKDHPVLLSAEYLGMQTYNAYQKLKENQLINPSVFKAIENHEYYGKALQYLDRLNSDS